MRPIVVIAAVAVMLLSSCGGAATSIPVQKEDFTESGEPHTNRWNVYDGPGTSGRGRMNPENVTVADGRLVITGRGDDVGGLCWCGPETPDFAFGDYKFKARIERGTGYVPAILLWPDSERWPIDGEIDMYEVSSGDRSSARATLHYDADNKQFEQSRRADYTQWHTILLRWRPDSITIFHDGKLVLSTQDKRQIPQTSMHLAVQLDLADGVFAKSRDETTPPEVRLEVDDIEMKPIRNVSKSPDGQLIR